MRATISQLWDTHREIISFDDSECDRPHTISDLKKCENVIVGAKVCKGGPTEVLIEEGSTTRYIYITPVRLQHPSGGGSMYVLEVL